MKPRRFLLPALFLFVLGTGNIYVGLYKEMQYKQVYEELSDLGPSPDVGDSSGLGRLESLHQTNQRYVERQLEAKDRLQHYRLVTFGGKVFIASSILLMAAAVLLHFTGRTISGSQRFLPQRYSPEGPSSQRPRSLGLRFPGRSKSSDRRIWRR